MKRGVVIIILIGVLLFSPLIQAQSYSGFNKFVDNVKLFFSSGDGKVELALEIREKELNSAIENAKIGNNEEVIKNLEDAKDKLKIVQEKVSINIAEEVRANIEESQNKIEENKNVNSEVSEYFETYLTEEEKTKLSVELSEKVFNYCKELASQSSELMANDEKCKSYSWMEKTVGEKIETEKSQDMEEIKNQIAICMNNPKDCNCDEISLLSEKANCEKYKALTVRCEFQSDGAACDEIEDLNDGETEVDREKYEKEILEKYVPGECLEAGVMNGEECKKLIITLYRPESECIVNGVVLGEEACSKKLVDEEKIPEDCIKDGVAISEEECLNILKEKSKPEGEEFALMSGECKERGVYDPVACDEIVNLPRPCKDAGYYTKTECASFTLNNNLPQECIDAGALTPEACEKLKLPSDCQGAYTREECETVRIEQKFPEECKSAGEFDPEKCAVIMIGSQSLVVTAGAEMEYLVRQGLTFEEIPSVCLNGKNFIRSMDCDAELAKLGITLPTPTDTGGIPKECMIDERTAVSPQECQNKLEKNIIVDTIPKECQDAEVITPEECSNFMEEKRIQEGIGINMPEECFGISTEECKIIMEQKGIKVEKIEQVQKVEKIEKVCKEGEVCNEEPTEYEEVTIPEECIKLGISDYDSCKMSMAKINGERIKQGDKIVVDKEGNTDYITGEQINEIVEESESNSQDVQPDFEKGERIKQEIENVERDIQQIEEKGVISETNEISEGLNEQGESSVGSGGGEGVSSSGEGNSDGENNVVVSSDSGGNGESSSDSGDSGGDSGSESSGSDSGGESSSITGGAIGTRDTKKSFFEKMFEWIF